MKFKMILTMAGLIVCMGAFAQSDDLSPAEFKKLLDTDKNVVLLDVRTADEVQSGVIGKPLTIDYFQQDFNDKVKALDKSKTYLVYCASGFRSAEAVAMMKKNGFSKAYNLQGGINKWAKSKMPINKQ